MSILHHCRIVLCDILSTTLPHSFKQFPFEKIRFTLRFSFLFICTNTRCNVFLAKIYPEKEFLMLFSTTLTQFYLLL